jgi:cyclophilin family peptidyl-prolyl cis-trans isomerase
VARATLLALSVVACQSRPSAPSAAGAAASSAGARASAAVLAPASRAELLRSAELRRSEAEISEADLSSRDVETRRAAARALARIASENSVARLLPELADEDPEVIAWAAHGIGQRCGRNAKWVGALATRAASLHLASGPSNAASRLDPSAALAGALARCGTLEAELTLRSWLERDKERASFVPRALAKLAQNEQRLHDATQVALLDLVAQRGPTQVAALFPFAHLPELAPAVQGRLFELLPPLLNGADREIVLRTLTAAGPESSHILERVAQDPAQPAMARALAVRSLVRLGDAADAGVTRVLLGLATPERAPLGAEFRVLQTALDALKAAPRELRPALERWAAWPLPAEEPEREKAVLLRCGAAQLLAGRSSAAALLLACDPDPNGVVGQLARVRVLGRGPLEGARHAGWKKLNEAESLLVQQAALALLAQHPEARDAPHVLVAALSRGEPGSVTLAARLLAAQPELASPPEDREAKRVRPPPELMDAVARALARAPAEAVEQRIALVDAVAALQLLSQKPALESACRSPIGSLRARAELAFRALGERTRRCASGEPAPAPPLAPRPARLVLVTESGEHELRLDPTWAPAAAARVLELARARYYDDTVVHRVLPGFVVQLGDRDADGFDDPARPPLPSETTPIPFGAFHVGFAESSRDAGTTQLFVTLTSAPHLDGELTWIGTASASFANVRQGERIQRVRVLE